MKFSTLAAALLLALDCAKAAETNRPGMLPAPEFPETKIAEISPIAAGNESIPALRETPPIAPAAHAEAASVGGAAGPSLISQGEALRRRWIESKLGHPYRDTPTLQTLFDGAKIESVFNGDAGEGSWQRQIIGQPWLSDHATIVGFDLSQPTQYLGGPRPAHSQDWVGIKILTDADDPSFPKPRTVAVVHAAFPDMDPFAADLGRESHWPARLRKYADLARPGGYLMIAHSEAYIFCFQKGASARQFIENAVAEIGGWRKIAAFADGQLPRDYPVTPWWERFEADHPGKGFLLIFQKAP